MEVLSTVEGLESLEPTQVNARLLPLKDWNAGEDSYYADMLEELNTGHTALFRRSHRGGCSADFCQRMEL